MEQKLVSVAAMLLLLAFAFAWGRWCAGLAMRRGWDLQRAGQRATLCLLACVPALVLYDWRLFPAVPLMITLSRWSCFRKLRPGERFFDLEERFAAQRNGPITLNLNRVDPPAKARWKRR